MLKSKCRSCGEEIVWLKTNLGKNIPVNYETSSDMSVKMFDNKIMISHFSTCKDAKNWRTKR